MSKLTMDIPKNFILGASTSAWQTEGWCGKKENQDSYLDLWYKNDRDVWYEGYGPAIATDLINRYQEEVDLMKKVGITHYRTSINWSRFLTDYENAIIDEDYAKYYDDFLTKIVENGIVPMLCLEHYEVPAELFNKYGGWNSKHVVELFVKFAEKVFERYHNTVKRWFVFNEPIVIQTRVYLDAERWPYEQNTNKWMQWNHHKNLATAKVVQLFRHKNYQGSIGTIINPEVTYPRSSSKEDQQAAKMYDLFYNRVFLDPAFNGEYPQELIDLLAKHKVQWDYTNQELEIIKKFPVDEVAINLYFPHRVKAPTKQWHKDAPFHPAFYYESFTLPGRKMNKSRGWEIYPKIVYDFAMRVKQQYNNKSWFICENGMGIEDEQRFKDDQGMIQDDYRIDFISKHLYWTLKAINDGANCGGYMLWAFTDNVSPMNAFKNRYGLIEIDLEQNRNRRLKKSALWFEDLSKTRQLTVNLDDEDK